MAPLAGVGEVPERARLHGSGVIKGRFPSLNAARMRQTTWVDEEGGVEGIIDAFARPP